MACTVHNDLNAGTAREAGSVNYVLIKFTHFLRYFCLVYIYSNEKAAKEACHYCH